MGIDACITSSTRQVLVLTIWDMEMGFRVTVFLGQSEINHVDLVSALSNTHEKIIRFNITVDERFGMNIFNTRDELIRKE